MEHDRMLKENTVEFGVVDERTCECVIDKITAA
jgi:hypothetical protein